jgi:hypothetical protein
MSPAVPTAPVGTAAAAKAPRSKGVARFRRQPLERRRWLGRAPLLPGRVDRNRLEGAEFGASDRLAIHAVDLQLRHKSIYDVQQHCNRNAVIISRLALHGNSQGEMSSRNINVR